MESFLNSNQESLLKEVTKSSLYKVHRPMTNPRALLYLKALIYYYLVELLKPFSV